VPIDTCASAATSAIVDCPRRALTESYFPAPCAPPPSDEDSVSCRRYPFGNSIVYVHIFWRQTVDFVLGLV